MCVCVCTRLTSPWREWSGRRRLEGGSSTLRGPGTGACERLEETHRHTHKRTLGEVSGLGSNELFALLVLWEPGIKRRDTLDTSRTLLFPPCRRNVCVCVCAMLLCVLDPPLGADVASWFHWFIQHELQAVVKKGPHILKTHTDTHPNMHTNKPSRHTSSLLLAEMFSNKRNTDSSTLCPHTVNIPSPSVSLFVPFKGSHLSTGST